MPFLLHYRFHHFAILQNVVIKQNEELMRYSKSRYTKPILVLTVLFCAFTINSCNEGNIIEPVPIVDCMDKTAINYNPYADVSDESCIYPSFKIKVQYLFNAQRFFLDSIYSKDGVNLKLSTAQFYLSNFRLVNADSTEFSFGDKTLLITPNVDTYELGQCQSKRVVGMKFDIGLSETDNNTMPVDWPTSSSLANNDMYINSSYGYSFASFKGILDLDYDLIFSTPLNFTLGTSDARRTLAVPFHLNLTQQNEDVDLVLDLFKLFEGIDLTTNNQTNTIDNSNVSDILLANFPESIEED